VSKTSTLRTVREPRLVEGPPGAAEAPTPELETLSGSSPAIRRVLTAIERVSRYKVNVLILGESGTGKELIARALHARGARRHQRFIPLNCATLGRDLLENELFGHEKGAFTGATERKTGLLELADGGTLFLDEIGEMDPSTQAKLLRVLERNEFRRVGGTEKVKVDLSVVAATNRDLDEAIQAKRFREDLYYRLKVVTIQVPPLRERKEDIPTLVDRFLADFNRRNGGRIRGMTPEALARILEHEWPGNVRELKNAVESAAILAGQPTIDVEALADLRPHEKLPRSAGVLSASSPDRLAFRVGTPLAQVERELIFATLARYPNRRQAAAVLGLGLRTLYSKLRVYGEASVPIPHRVRR
jgi:DNA-binding NtrC family response regulator